MIAFTQACSLSCNDLYRNSHLSNNLNETIAHAMNVEALQMFNPCVIALNPVPTVNVDRSALQKFLPYASENPIGSYFSTHSMNVTDKTLTKLVNPMMD